MEMPRSPVQGHLTFRPRHRLAYDLNLEVVSLEAPMLEGLFQPTHLLIIFFIALLVFGPKKLPELGKGLGDGIRALKEGMKETPATQASTDQDKKTETKS
jgi:sec-independent protein translocase protein TatA